MTHKLLMVDDDKTLLLFISEFFQKRGFEVDTAASGEEAIAKVTAAPTRYSLVIVDYQMDGKNGAQTTEMLLSINPKLLVLIYSGNSERDALLVSSRSGAIGVVDKSEGPDVLLDQVNRMCLRFVMERQTIQQALVPSERSSEISKIGMVGNSENLAAVSEQVQMLRKNRGAVLILGETGCGKELVAQALHAGPKHSFKSLNCGDFLLGMGTARSELFGHVKGAFTGADRDRPGIFEEAGAGTVFLDEIYSLPLEAQISLLRALEEKVVKRIGSQNEIKIHCRIIAAAKPDLIEEVKKANFKPDLFYRISHSIVEIAPLRERPEDIGPLVDLFCRQWSAENGRERTFLASTVDYLARYSWPGNAREVENIVFTILNTTAVEEIAPEHLGRRFLDLVGSAPSNAPQRLKQFLDEAERKHVVDVSSRSKTAIEAAKKLGINYPNYFRLLNKYDLKSQDIVGASFKRKTKAVR